MKDSLFIEKYLKDFSNIIKPEKKLTEQIIHIKNLNFLNKKNKCKVLIFGNGGSASISNHFSLDLTKNAKVRCVNFNDSSLITCFANDYGFEHWIEKTIEFYSNPGDLLILISSSGSSKNMINAAKIAKKKNISKINTLTGFNKNNPLKKLGDVNLWINSKSYNFIENAHQIWLLSIVDLIIGRREYLIK